jgi:hypothetical protein
MGGIQGLLAYGWNQMRDFTDQMGEDAANGDPRRWTFTADGSLDTAGTISGTAPGVYPSYFGSSADQLFAPVTRILDWGSMSPQGYGQQFYDSLPGWLGGGEGGPIADFVNDISKVHDFYEGWDYSAGQWISRGAAFNGLYDIYGSAGMIPSAIYTEAALSPSAAYMAQIRH